MDELINKRSRKWQLTINNPVEHGFTHDVIKENLSKLKSIIFWCLCDEIGSTYHTHIYIVANEPIRFSTLKNKFPSAHLEFARGSSAENRDYILKQGKWLKDKKHETNLADTFESFGECPVERQGQRNDLIDLIDMVKDGKTNVEIVENIPQFALQLDKIDRMRSAINEEKFKDRFRELVVTYVFGSPGSGKTKNVMESHGYSNVYRVTDYRNPFDTYAGQDVLVFEEFRSSLKINDMLNYLDGYPLLLPARFSNKVACYTKVYIITNIPLEQQFWSVQKDCRETWNAFLRRIHNVKHYDGQQVLEYSTKEYLNTLNTFKNVVDIDDIPFKQMVFE